MVSQDQNPVLPRYHRCLFYLCVSLALPTFIGHLPFKSSEVFLIVTVVYMLEHTARHMQVVRACAECDIGLPLLAKEKKYMVLGHR